MRRFLPLAVFALSIMAAPKAFGLSLKNFREILGVGLKVGVGSNAALAHVQPLRSEGVDSVNETLG